MAHQREKRTSDIDIALEGKSEIPMKKMIELRDKLDESTLPYHVDIVDLSHASDELVEKVKQEGILWRDYRSESKVQIEH